MTGGCARRRAGGGTVAEPTLSPDGWRCRPRAQNRAPLPPCGWGSRVAEFRSVLLGPHGV